jgi:hypothetical protein
MKLRWVIPAFLVASILAVPVALARDGGTVGCKQASYVLTGTYGATVADSISVTVERASRRGLAGRTVAVEVTDRTRVRRNGRAALADLVAGDELRVHARGCRAGAELRLVARTIVATPAAPVDDDEPVVDDPIAIDG